MPSLADASAQILAAGAPVLFADTCSLLDVIRTPTRLLRGCVESAAELLQLVSSVPPQCVLVVGSFVPGEWQAHASATADELRKYLARLDEQAAYFHNSCGALGIAPPFGRPGYGAVGLADRLLDLSSQLLGRAIHLAPQNDTNLRAFNRAATNTPPSGKGGESKDSTIIEECLEVCRLLQAGGFARKRVFCTSNTDDYCEATKALHPLLVTEFTAVGLGFTKDLPWALHEMKT